jgi:hypothetical protein
MKAARATWAAPALRSPYKRAAVWSTQRWHFGQKKVERPPWTMRLTLPPQAQGFPSRS